MIYERNYFAILKSSSIIAEFVKSPAVSILSLIYHPVKLLLKYSHRIDLILNSTSNGSWPFGILKIQNITYINLDVQSTNAFKCKLETWSSNPRTWNG